MLRSGVRVANSHCCCRCVVGFSNFRQTGTPAGTALFTFHVLAAPFRWLSNDIMLLSIHTWQPGRQGLCQLLTSAVATNG